MADRLSGYRGCQLLRRWGPVMVVMLLAMTWGPASSLYAENFETVVIHLDYHHTLYAPEPGGGDLVFRFGAYTSCFDGKDDDNDDGQPDKWAIPHWVAYEIKGRPGPLPRIPEAPDELITDSSLYSQRLAPSGGSYVFSRKWRKANPKSTQLGYVPGLLCPPRHAFRLGEDTYWNAHTVLNACPQKSELYRGIWQDLSERIEDWVDEFRQIWVMAGPVVYHGRPAKWLGEKGEVPVAVPDAFFKIVARQINDQLQVLAFVYPQEGNAYKRRHGYDHTPYLTSVDIIEALTGLDFFPKVPAHVEREIEGRIPTRLWD